MPLYKDTYGGMYSVLSGRDISEINDILEETDVYFYLEPKYKKLVTHEDFRGLPKSVLLYLLQLVYNIDVQIINRYSIQSAKHFRGEEEQPHYFDPEMLGSYKRSMLIMGRAIKRLKADQRKIGWPSYKGNPSYPELEQEDA